MTARPVKVVDVSLKGEIVSQTLRVDPHERWVIEKIVYTDGSFERWIPTDPEGMRCAGDQP